MITVATWNVLHRVHADNWDSSFAGRWPEDKVRIEGVTSVVAGRSEQVIALQEVSGDQLASLREALPGREFHVLRYPRVPRPRRVASMLQDRTEHLVLIVAGAGRNFAAGAFASDPGKGYLAVLVDGVLIVATHVTGDDRRGGQFARLAELTAGGPVVLLGDFNAPAAEVVAALGTHYTVAELPVDAIATRPRGSDAEKSQFIDHVVTRGITARDTAVEDVAGVSDHNLVRATIG
ncbi:endonuclease/exonuclease/phosphatase family protein [Nocardia sp. NBC_01503]|uniref:endonuclease/exonuclease/phosphatase family protein n=1 Tax=Nocardia sp. NBC_01503 TaxID=2975997 RepID=UPI002E7B05E6|nr:endonuclease/exonuclease/phosphatase family protein [Nocardia sp. NBC_01503]WTL34792.1 endonuclease/exonuclease/phosphatase family protein [Nocardia sp. NBC_01503]